MEPLEIFDAINSKVINIYVSKEIAQQCRMDTDFAQDLFNKLKDQNLEEGCSVEIETIKAEANDEEDNEENNGFTDGEEVPAEEKIDNQFWSRSETLKLITLYKKFKDNDEHAQKKFVWSQIAAELSLHNIFRSAAKCAEKWKNLVRTYKVVNEKPGLPRKFQYYQEVHDILNNTEILISDNETDDIEMKYKVTPEELIETKQIFSEETSEKESWSRYETLKFLKAFQMYKHMKNDFSKEKHFWSIVSAQLAKDGIHKQHDKCAAKWKNLLRSYKKNLGKSVLPTRFQYFQEMSDVMNDTELEIPLHMRVTDDEKSEESEQVNDILKEADTENTTDPVSWSISETQALIEAYKKHKDQFSTGTSKKTIWTMISSELIKQGIIRNTDKVENKWKSLLRAYRRGESPRFYFYDQMSELLDDGNEADKDFFDKNTSINNTEIVFENFDHAYSENPGYEKIIIQTEEDKSNIDENNWSHSETSALIAAYEKFNRKSKEADTELWEEVSRELKSVDVHKSAETCEKKWKKLLGLYKMYKLNKTGSSQFRFFEEINDVIKNENSSSDEVISGNKKCKCSEKRLQDKQNRHMERMQLLKRKLDIEERKVDAFELYVKHLKSNNSVSRNS